MWGTADVKNKYLYNGKELNSDFGLDWSDYGARYYDAAIGRWGQVDPLAEMYYSTTSYGYVLNNPIGLIDPNGMSAESPIFDRDGNFLGTDSEGFKGDIIIMDADAYHARTKDTSNPLDHDQVMLWANNSPLVQTLDDYVANDYVSSNSQQDFLSNVFTNLITEASKAGLIDFKTSQLSQGKFNIEDDFDYPYGGAANSSRERDKERINIFIKPMSYESAFASGKFDRYAKRDKQSLFFLGDAANAIHILGVHEPLHRKFPSNKLHKEMYKYIYKNKSLRKSLKNVTPNLLEFQSQRGWIK